MDYRGVPILAATRRLKRAPWGLIVKVDREEALADVRRELTLLGVAAVAFYAAFLGAVHLLGQRQRSRYELALARREARTALALREANDAIFLVSPDGRIREAMGAAERLYGRSASELCALTAADLRTPEARGEALANVQAAFAQGTGVFETIHQDRDGQAALAR